MAASAGSEFQRPFECALASGVEHRSELTGRGEGLGISSYPL